VLKKYILKYENAKEIANIKYSRVCKTCQKEIRQVLPLRLQQKHFKNIRYEYGC